MCPISAVLALQTTSPIKDLRANSRSKLNGNFCRPNRELNPLNQELRELTANHQKTVKKRPIYLPRQNAINHRSDLTGVILSLNFTVFAAVIRAGFSERYRRV